MSVPTACPNCNEPARVVLPDEVSACTACNWLCVRPHDPKTMTMPDVLRFAARMLDQCIDMDDAALSWAIMVCAQDLLGNVCHAIDVIGPPPNVATSFVNRDAETN
jgi:hypothetical protein